MINRPTYCTREDVKRALDRAEGVTADWEIDRAVETGSLMVEHPDVLNRVFYPTVTTRYFDWPVVGSRPWVLWLDENELVSVITITNGSGDALPATDYFLEPRNVGPPYASVEIDLSSGASFEAATGTYQRSVAITGVFGYDVTTRAAGAAGEALDDSETELTVSDASKIGVGDLLTVGAERLLVQDRVSVTTGLTLGGDITAAKNVEQFTASGAGLNIGEVVTIDAESMLVVAIASTTITVRRAWDNTTLAAHSSGATIYAPRSLTVQRGVLGTTAAAHVDGAALTVHDYPPPVRSLAIAEALTMLGQERSGYARSIGSGDSAREHRGAGLKDVRKAVRGVYGRKGRCW